MTSSARAASFQILLLNTFQVEVNWRSSGENKILWNAHIVVIGSSQEDSPLRGLNLTSDPTGTANIPVGPNIRAAKSLVSKCWPHCVGRRWEVRGNEVLTKAYRTIHGVSSLCCGTDWPRGVCHSPSSQVWSPFWRSENVTVLQLTRTALVTDAFVVKAPPHIVCRTGRIIVLHLYYNYIYSTLGISFLLPVFYCTLEYCVSLMQCARVKYLCLHCVLSGNIYALPLLSEIMVIQSPTENCSAAF